jgi:hypothetical protein
VLCKRALLAVLCILIVLAGALLAPQSGGSSPAVLVPLAPLFGLVVLPAPAADDPTPAFAYLVPGPRPSRAPPVVS